MKRFLLLLLIIPLLSACKKEDPVVTLEMTGRVLNPITGLPVAGVDVRFKAQEITGGVWSSAYATYATATTDGNGYFTVSFDKTNNVVEYKVELSKDLYFGTEYIVPGDDITADAVYQDDYGLYAQAWMTVTLKNTNSFDSDDQIRYQKTSSNEGCSFCCPTTPITLVGETVDSTWTCSLYGETTVAYSWFVTKNTFVNTFMDSSVATSFDTLSVVINY